MRLPQLTELATAKDNTEEFLGLNHNLRASVGEWYDQKNMTCDYYPVASPRDKRATQYVSEDYKIKVKISDVEGTNDISKKILGCAFLDNQFLTLRSVKAEQDTVGAWFTNNEGTLGMMNNGQDYEFESGTLSMVNGKLRLEVNAVPEVDLSEIQENLNVKYDLKYEISGYKLHEEYTLNLLEKVDEKYIFIFAEDFEAPDANAPVKNISIFPDRRKTRHGNIVNNYSTLFDKNNNMRQIVRMGSYACVFPDGVVYETENTEDDIPVFKINRNVEETGISFETVIVNNLNKTEYVPINIPMHEGSFRFSDGQIQHYIQDSNIWVNQQTYVKIYKNGAHLFDDFNVGDTVKMVFNKSAPSDVQFAGLFEWDSKSNKFVEKLIKILKKGTSPTDSSTDYIIVDGFVIGVYGSAHTDVSSTLYITDSVSFTRKMPDIAFACESQNRIWACSKDGHEIYASALGNPYNFYDYSGISTDSYAVNVGSDGQFTACFNYLGQPLFFKENTLHTVTGSYPSNGGAIDGFSYAVSTMSNFKGVEKGSEKSLAVIDNILYYKSSAGIVAYDGATTSVISYPLGKEKYKNAVAGAYNNKYYVSMQDSKGVYHLFTYDTIRGVWCKEDDVQVTNFIQIENELLFTTIDDVVYSVSDENVLNLEGYKKEDDFEWECETGNYGYSYPNNKYLSRFQIRMQLAQGSKAAFYIQYNSDGIWHRKGEMNGKGIRTHLIPIVPIRCDHMKIKIAGTGDAKIYSIAKIFEEGGDV